MATGSDYHLKELVWFHGWTPSHWILIDAEDGMMARLPGEVGPLENTGLSAQRELPVLPDMLIRIEKVRPNSLPAMMGFDFLLCEGEPGSAVLNRPMDFPAIKTNPVQGVETR